MENKYTIQYFIDKFEKIPDDQWCADGSYIDMYRRCCALGHCGANTLLGQTEESKALLIIFGRYNASIAYINDGSIRTLPEYVTGSTPKARVLSALRHFQK